MKMNEEEISNDFRTFFFKNQTNIEHLIKSNKIKSY